MKNYEISITDFFEGFDKKKIRYAIFGNNNYSGLIIILQGRAEYYEKYHHISEYYIKKGYLTALLDWRGQGGSERELDDRDKGHIEDFSHYQNDLKIFIEIISNFIKQGTDAYAIAHSMGGHNLMRYLIENKNSFFKKVIFSSPMLGIETSPMPEKIAFLTAKACVKAGLKKNYVPNTGKYRESKFKNNPLTSDSEKFFENIYYLRKNRQLAIGGPTYSWVYNAFLSMKYIEENISKIDKKVKTKIIYGSDDKVVKLQPIMRISKFMTEPSFEIKRGKHELMMETPEKINDFFCETDKFFLNG